MRLNQRLGYRTVVTLATVTAAINVLDRSLINILAEAIKRDLAISDTQLGLLTGFFFALFYMLAGLPIARFVDRQSANRPVVVSICIAVWSVMTMASGLAVSFVQMVLARLLVAIGESGSGPALFSLIQHAVPKEKRTHAFGIYGMGPPAGNLLGLMVGGFLIDLVGWRTTFAIIGLPGLVVGLAIFLLMPEPRRAAAPATMAPQADSNLADILRILMKSPTYMWLLAAFATEGIILLVMPTFTGVYLIRVLGFSATQAGLILGVSLGGGGAIGAYWGGLVGTWLGRNDPAKSVLAPAIGLIIGIPFAIVAYTTDSWLMFACTFWMQAFGATFYLGPCVARAQSILPPSCHATATFILFTAMQLVGAGLGPLIIGLGSDYLTPALGVLGLRRMLVCLSMSALVPAFLYVMASGWPSRKLQPVAQ